MKKSYLKHHTVWKSNHWGRIDALAILQLQKRQHWQPNTLFNIVWLLVKYVVARLPDKVRSSQVFMEVPEEHGYNIIQ